MNTRRQLTRRWVTLDLRPVADGWKVVYLAEPGESFTTPMVGWLVQASEDYWLDPVELVAGQPPLAERDRRVVAADADPQSGEVEAVDESNNFWRLLAPGEPMPTAEEVKQEQAERQNRKQHRNPEAHNEQPKP